MVFTNLFNGKVMANLLTNDIKVQLHCSLENNKKLEAKKENLKYNIRNEYLIIYLSFKKF